VIKSFGDKCTKGIFDGQYIKGLDPRIQLRARQKLKLLDAAAALLDLKSPPGNRLELLKGNRLGQFSIRINDQWRVCFRWEDNHATEVEIADYH
jgi:toxin HigB-1